MRKARVLFVLGVWIAVLPYLGFPSLWKNILLTLSGLGVALWGYLSYRELKMAEERASAPDNFTENQRFMENKTAEGEQI